MRRYYINDPEVMVDAIVHCIDRTSGREPVHDPAREFLLKQEAGVSPGGITQARENYKVYKR